MPRLPLLPYLLLPLNFSAGVCGGGPSGSHNGAASRKNGREKIRRRIVKERLAVSRAERLPSGSLSPLPLGIRELFGLLRRRLRRSSQSELPKSTGNRWARSELSATWDTYVDFSIFADSAGKRLFFEEQVSCVSDRSYEKCSLRWTGTATTTVSHRIRRGVREYEEDTHQFNSKFNSI